MKRSSQVALLLMGAGAVGGASYAAMPQRDCSAPAQQTAVAPDASGTRSQRSCGGRWGGHWSGGWSWRSTSAQSGSSIVGQSGSTTTSRGGFGSIGHFFSGGS
jgi:hypothetical protein